MDRHPRTAGVSPDAAMPAGLPGAIALDVQARTENFPVALRLLPRDVRTDLSAIYGFARLADDIGDEYDGDRLAALDWLEHDLDAVDEGRARHPVVARLRPTIERRALDLTPFRDLIEANRRDQRQRRYATFDDLREYCRLSARPVGRLVLAVFGIDDPAASRLSDDVCDGLQVVEHLQDVGEDAAAGRVYLPQDDLAELGCKESDLLRPAATPALRRVVALEAGRARALLGSGRALSRMLPVRPRVAIAGFTAGGLAALDAIEGARFDVLANRCRPRTGRLAHHAAGMLVPRRRTVAEVARC